MFLQNDSIHQIVIDSINNKLPIVKMEQYSNIVESQAQDSANVGIWIPFLSAIVGGLLVLAGQYFDRKHKRKREMNISLREIYAFCRKLEAEMRNNYRELAMFKVHAEYWWYCHNCKGSNNDSFRDKYYHDHLQSQGDAREVERRIGETKASFIGHVRKFQVLRSITKEIEDELVLISNLKHKKAKAYDHSLDYDKVRNELIEIDEQELRDDYYKNLEPFDKINAYLYEQVKTKGKGSSQQRI